MPNWKSRHLGGYLENVNSKPYRPWLRAVQKSERLALHLLVVQLNIFYPKRRS